MIMNNVIGVKIKPGQKRIFTLIPYICAILVLVILPPFLNNYLLSMLTKVVIFGIFAMSFDLVLGYTGLSSLGHAIFLGVGGYAFGLIMIRSGIESFWILTLLAILVSGLVSAIVGYIALRVSGLYFLLITLAFSQMFFSAATKFRDLTGGTDGLIGIKYPELGIPGFSLTNISLYYLIFLALVMCFFLLYRIINSSFGHTLVGIRENERRMKSLGYNTWAYKYLSFIVGGIFAGVAGALFAPFYGSMSPDHFGLIMSTEVLLMVVVGGPGTLVGPIIGALVVVSLESVSSIYSPQHWPLILGLAFVICVTLLRGGIAIYLSKLWRKIGAKLWNY